MEYKFYEDVTGHHVRNSNDDYLFSTDTVEKAQKIAEALKKQESIYDKENKPTKCPWCGNDKIELEHAYATFSDGNQYDIWMYFCMNKDCDWNSNPFEY